MPQMAPINWLSLFFLFIMIYMMFCILNYFNFYLMYPTQNLTIKTFNKNFLNWKW